MEPLVCRVVREPIDGAGLLARCTSEEDGAALLFLGVVRNHNDGRPVGSLEYHAYAEMAEGVMRQIIAEAAERWEAGRIGVVHRVGQLEVGEASVAIVVAAPHRDAAYEASRYIIEELKKRVPIWKKEGYVDGDREWLGGSAPADARAEAADA